MSLARRIFSVVAGLVFVGAAVALVYMAKRNHDLKETIAQLQQSFSAAHTSGLALKTGEVLEPVELPTLAGEMKRLGYEDPRRDTLLLVFSPECPACKENIENWKKLEAAHDASREDLHYISTLEPELTVDFARDHALGEVLLSTPEALAKLKIEEIPTTILVGPGGVVKKVWTGVLPAEAVTELGGAGS